jgi:hypothetical protein
MSMVAVFSEWAKANLPDVDWEDQNIRMTVLVRGAFYDSNDNVTDGLYQETLSELLVSPGWQAASGTQANTAPDGELATAVENTSGGVTEIGGTLGFAYASLAPVFAVGFALSIDAAAPNDKLICVFHPSQPVYLTGDPDDDLNWARLQPVSTGPYLFAFLDTLTEGSCNPQLGAIRLSVPTVDWEDARSAHIWLDPQRINYAVNPSFEASGAADLMPYGWRSNTTMTKERGGIRPPQGMTPQSRQFCARLTGAESPKVLESSLFPAPSDKSWWSIEAAVAGTGRVRIGVVFWHPELLESETVYVVSGWFDLSSSFEYAAPEDSEDEVIHQGEFRVVRALIPTPENSYQGQVRLEFEGYGDIWVDNVLAEPNEAQGGYFDGEWEFGQVGDYSWYTGSGVQNVNSPHKTFSLFYNNRRAIRAALVDAPVTEPPPQYNIQSWVPEGASTVVHWDDVFSSRTHSWIDDIYIPTLDFADKTIVTSVGETISIFED